MKALNYIGLMMCFILEMICVGCICGNNNIILIKIIALGQTIIVIVWILYQGIKFDKTIDKQK